MSYPLIKRSHISFFFRYYCRFTFYLIMSFFLKKINWYSDSGILCIRDKLQNLHMFLRFSPLDELIFTSLLLLFFLLCNSIGFNAVV